MLLYIPVALLLIYSIYAYARFADLRGSGNHKVETYKVRYKLTFVLAIILAVVCWFYQYG